MQKIESGNVYLNQEFSHLTVEELVSETEFANCKFVHCDFTKVVFADCKISNCTFEKCNLSLVKLDGSTLTDTTFTECRLMGIDFSKLSGILASFDFAECDLELAGFSNMRLRNRKFVNCKLKDAYFLQTDLQKSDFSKSDLTGARFEKCDLQQANFAGALNYAIDPANNILKKAKFSLPDVLALLDTLEIEVVEAPATETFAD